MIAGGFGLFLFAVGSSRPSQLVDESKVLPELQWISLNGQTTLAKDTSKVGECNSHSAVTKV